jgi:enoyl-CoA hydratase/carnithine racemase
MCDLAVASDNAKFAVSGINVGLFCSTPAVGLGRGTMGAQAALEMLLTGEFIDAMPRRKAAGLVNRVVPLDRLDAEIEAISPIVDHAPRARSPSAMGKQHVLSSSSKWAWTRPTQLAADAMACNMMAEDAGEGIDAFMEKRKPEWKHR